MRTIDADLVKARALIVELDGVEIEAVPIGYINGAPTIDTVKRGRWGTNSDYPDTVICSVCGYRADVWFVDKGTPYCPNCGARMDEDGGRNDG